MRIDLVVCVVHDDDEDEEDEDEDESKSRTIRTIEKVGPDNAGPPLSTS